MAGEVIQLLHDFDVERPRRRRRWRDPSVGADLFDPLIDRGKRYWSARGKYRVFNAARYDIRWTSESGDARAPVESDAVDETASSLPHEITGNEFTGTDRYYFAVEQFNGVLSSGFATQDDTGRTFAAVDLDNDADISNRPSAPLAVSLEPRAGGVIRINAIYDPTADGSYAADAWAIAFDTSGPPAIDAPDYTQAISGTSGLKSLAYDLPAQSHGTTVYVVLQVRKNIGSGVYRYSWHRDGYETASADADATGPAAPPALDAWPGPPPGDQP